MYQHILLLQPIILSHQRYLYTPGAFYLGGGGINIKNSVKRDFLLRPDFETYASIQVTKYYNHAPCLILLPFNSTNYLSDN